MLIIAHLYLLHFLVSSSSSCHIYTFHIMSRHTIHVHVYFTFHMFSVLCILYRHIVVVYGCFAHFMLTRL